MVSDDHRYYITQSEPVLRDLTYFILENGRYFTDEYPITKTSIPKRNGERISWVMDPYLHARYAKIGTSILGDMPGYLSELGGQSLFGHVPVEGTLFLENSSRSYGEGLDKKKHMWAKGMRYGIYLDIKEAYNSVNQQLVINTIEKHISEALAIDYFMLSCYFLTSDSIPHGYTTSHSIFYLIRAEIFLSLPEYSDNIIILNDDIYIFGKTVDQTQTIYSALLEVLCRMGLNENHGKTRQFGPTELENGTWAFDISKSSSEATALLVEILRFGDWRIWNTASNRNKYMNRGAGGLISSAEGNMGDEGNLSELDHNENYKLLWEDLTMVNYLKRLDMVDSTVLTKSISILDKYSSEILVGKEMRYIKESPYACSQVFDYSINHGSLKNNTVGFWGEIGDCGEAHSFVKALFTERLGNSGYLHTENALFRLANIAQDPFESLRYRTTTLRALKALGHNDLCGSAALMIGKSECMSLNLEIIDSLKDANKYIRKQLLDRFASTPQYRQAVDFLVA